MKEYFSSLDTHYNDFIENRLNVLSKQIDPKNAEYKNKRKCADVTSEERCDQPDHI